MTIYSASLQLGQQITALSNAGTLGREMPWALGYRLTQRLLAVAAVEVPSEKQWAEIVRLGTRLAAAGWRVAAEQAYRMGRDVARAATVAPAMAVAS